jgi:hypothetical protein
VFTVFSVPSDLAEREECSGGAPLGTTTKEKYGEYFGAAFRFHDGGLNEGTLYLLWTAQYKHWQIVNLKYIEGNDTGLPWSTQPVVPEETAQLRSVPGNREANEAIHDFLASWLLKATSRALYRLFRRLLMVVSTSH